MMAQVFCPPLLPRLQTRPRRLLPSLPIERVCMGRGVGVVCELSVPRAVPCADVVQRNYPCDNIIGEYFGLSDFKTVGEEPFKQQLWQCVLAVACVCLTVQPGLSMCSFTLALQWFACLLA